MTNQLPTHPAEAALDRSDDRWVLRMERTLHHPAERVWTALTRADEIRRWAPYAPDRDLDAMGEVPLPQAEGGQPAEGPPEPGVRLSLTHTFDVGEEAADYASGWHLCLNALSARLDGKDVPPVAGSVAREYGWQDLRDEYAVMLAN
jgi:hypothetical protein